MDESYALAKAAIAEAARRGLNDIHAEALHEIVDLFEPYRGDDPMVAQARQSSGIVCGRCTYRTKGMFFPAPVSQVAKAGLRLAICPRCFATNSMVLAPESESPRLPARSDS